jgi:hypothetical protein
MSGENNPNYNDGYNVGRNSPDREVRRLAEMNRDHNDPKRIEVNIRKHEKYRAKNKAETGYTHGHSQAKKKAETQGEGTLDTFLK